MEGSFLTGVLLPLSLAIIMMGMGLSLVINDFKRIIVFPKSILIGLTNQLILLPIIGFLLVQIFKLDPTMAIGVMIIAVCPGGPTSNLITQVCKGDIALSVTLTAITSFLTIITIPIVLNLVLNYYALSAENEISLPVGETILKIMGITIVPVSIGMLIRIFNKKFADRMEKPMRVASAVIFVVILLAVTIANKDELVVSIKQVGIITLLLNLATMGLGYLTARIFKLKLKRAISITIESGIQNGTLAIVIATSIIMINEMSIPALSYSLWMFLNGGILMWILGRR